MTEQAVQFSAHSLVGVLTEAQAGPASRKPAIVFLNAGMLHRVGPNRLHVRIARELARQGYASLRFDCSGIGDSPPRTDGLPRRAAVLEDVREALDFVAAERGAPAFILFGLCSGADLAFRAALADERIIGAVLIDGLPYANARARLHHALSRIARPGIWRRLFALDGPVLRRLRGSRKQARPAATLDRRDVPPKEEAEAGMRRLTERGVRFLLVFTPGREYCYERQFRDMFASVRDDRVEVVYMRDANHTFTLRANQDLLVRTVGDWVAAIH